MEYFKNLSNLLTIEREEDRKSYQELSQKLSASARRANGISWYPVAIRGTEMSRGDYITVELERTTHQEIAHQFRFGSSAMFFSNHNPGENRVEGTVAYQSGNNIKITLRTDELPDWANDGKLGIDLLFDDNSYEEMQNALKLAVSLYDKKDEPELIKILIGERKPSFENHKSVPNPGRLNTAQKEAVNKILSAEEIAVVHGPPGTGKTTTLVQAIKALVHQDNEKILVVAPSNTAVDLLSEKLSEEGLNVLRVGNPVRVSEKLMSLTLDFKMGEHNSMKAIRKLKKQASAFRDMAQKYKRNFGKAEREQRKALFDEAKKIMKEVINTEQYIIDDLIAKAQVIAATPVGANHYTVKNLRYKTVVIDEAGQALEPACWIPILKAKKLVLAGDHFQLPPTIKSDEAARKGLSKTLLEKAVDLYPEAVVLLEEQYRMNTLIMGYSSKVFYKDKLKANAAVAKHTVFAGDTPLAFIDTAGCGFNENAEDISISNPEEADFLFKHLNQYAEQLKPYISANEFPGIAIISPYKQQVDLLKQLLLQSEIYQQHGNKIAVNTIDGFQGQERDIVYISMTRSNTDNIIGFLSDTRRMNVAMTRARKKLVVIGDSATLSQLPFYENFINYAQENNAYQSAWEFMTD